MAFSEIELKFIDDIVGKICRRRSPPHLHNKIRITYEVSTHDVTIFEERPRFNHPNESSKMPCARFKYDRTNKLWKLYWMREDEKWHLYKMDTKSTELESLVAEVDKDSHGAFFG